MKKNVCRGAARDEEEYERRRKREAEEERKEIEEEVGSFKVRIALTLSLLLSTHCTQNSFLVHI